MEFPYGIEDDDWYIPDDERQETASSETSIHGGWRAFQPAISGSLESE